MAGTFINVTSLPADLIIMDYKFTYNGQIPLAVFKSQIIAAVQYYLYNLPFDGTFNVLHLEDAIQSVQGLVTAARGHIYANNVAIDTIYRANSGYMELDPNSALFNDIFYKAV